MKMFFKAASWIMTAALISVLNACDPQQEIGGNENETTSFDVYLGNTGAEYVEISIETANVDDVAYVCGQERQENLSPVSIYRNGKTLTASPEFVERIEGLLAEKTYYIYVAARKGDKYLDDVIEVEALTDSYKFDKLLTLLDVTDRGFKMQITVPDTVKSNPNRAIRYACSCLPLYLSRKGKGAHDTDMLYQNGEKETRTDLTVEWNESTAYVLDENGEPMIDPDTGDYLQNHDVMVPGEPIVFMAGEFEWGEGYIANWGPKGDGFGYFIPLYDFAGYYPDWGTDAAGELQMVTESIVSGPLPAEDEHPYWYGNFEKKLFVLDRPAELGATFEVISEPTPIDATVTIIPSENVEFYQFLVVSPSIYQQLLGMLMGKEEFVQWFVTSLFAQYQTMVQTAQGVSTFSVKNVFFGDYLNEDSEYYLLIVGFGNEEGTLQTFKRETLMTTAKTLPAPVVEVTPYESGEHEYDAYFHIKAPNKDVVEAYYGCDYLREWIPMLNDKENNYTYASLCQNPFSEEDIAAINSDEGLVVGIPALDGQTLRMAVLGYNVEHTANEIEAVGPAVADCKTKLLAMVPHVDSPLFEELVGEWTLEAVLHKKFYVNNVLQELNQKTKTKVTILNQVEVPALTQDVYDLYAEFGWGTDLVNGYYEDFKNNADIFNNYRLHYRNRLLCLGWYDKDIYDNWSRLNMRSPWELFTASDYNCYDNAEIFYDFGPKWYLEIAADGSVCVPVNQDKMPPMTYAYDAVYFVGGLNEEKNTAFKSHETGFPVEVSADMKTIKIKPVTKDGVPHYMNAIGGWGQNDATNPVWPVISEITLTKGWHGETQTSNASVMPDKSRVKGNPVKLTTHDARKVVMKSMTGLPEVMKVQKIDNPMILTEEVLNDYLDNLAKKYNR